MAVIIARSEGLTVLVEKDDIATRKVDGVCCAQAGNCGVGQTASFNRVSGRDRTYGQRRRQ